MPDKLREMQQLFLLEAAKYRNLPLTGPNDVDAQQHRLLRDHHVALPDDPDLIDELANVRPLETAPSNYRIDHDSSEHDPPCHLVGTSRSPTRHHFGEAERGQQEVGCGDGSDFGWSVQAERRSLRLLAAHNACRL